jgi:hypothetical protein
MIRFCVLFSGMGDNRIFVRDAALQPRLIEKISLSGKDKTCLAGYGVVLASVASALVNLPIIHRNAKNPSVSRRLAILTVVLSVVGLACLVLASNTIGLSGYDCARKRPEFWIPASWSKRWLRGPATPRKRHSLILPYRFELIREGGMKLLPGGFIPNFGRAFDSHRPLHKPG